MQVGIETLRATAGETFERYFIGQGEIIVRREGHSRVRHIFTINDRVIARLRWHGLRRALYETEDARFYIGVSALGKRISITSEDGGESFLVERSRANPNKQQLRVEMAEGDNFRLERSWDSRFRSDTSFIIHKEFYTSTLLVFRFDLR